MIIICAMFIYNLLSFFFVSLFANISKIVMHMSAKLRLPSSFVEIGLYHYVYVIVVFFRNFLLATEVHFTDIKNSSVVIISKQNNG